MENIRLHDKVFAPYLTAGQIEKAVEAVAEKINCDYHNKQPLFLVVLNGAFVFAADLIRRFQSPCDITFIKLSSYSGTLTTTYVREIMGLDTDVKGRSVIVVEDIIDTGITMDNMLKKLIGLGAAEVKVASLLYKPEAFRKKFSIDYIGFEIPNDFIVGYGLDYDGLGRNLPDIYQIVKD